MKEHIEAMTGWWFYQFYPIKQNISQCCMISPGSGRKNTIFETTNLDDLCCW